MVDFDKVVSVIEIADKYNISKQGVFKHIDRLGISTSKVGRKTVIVGSEEINRLISKIEENNEPKKYNVDELVDDIKSTKDKPHKFSNISVEKEEKDLDNKLINNIKSTEVNDENQLVDDKVTVEVNKEHYKKLQNMLLNLESTENEVKELHERIKDYSVLKSRLKDKEELINVLKEDKASVNETLKNTLKLLENQQVLNLRSTEKIQQLEQQLEQAQLKIENNSIKSYESENSKVNKFYKDLREDKNESKGFFSKLFNKK